MMQVEPEMIVLSTWDPRWDAKRHWRGFKERICSRTGISLLSTLTAIVLVILLWEESPKPVAIRGQYAMPVPPIPKKIWTLWDDSDGISIPPIIEAMIDGWAEHHPGYNLTILYPDSVQFHTSIPLPKNFFNPHMWDHRSKWARLAVLLEHGGFWIDPNVIITSNILDPIRKRAELNGKETFAYHYKNYTKDPDLPVFETFLLGSIPRSLWMTSWFTEYNMAFSNFHGEESYIKYLKSTLGDVPFRTVVQKLMDGPERQRPLLLASQLVLSTEEIPLPDTEASEEGPYRLLEECRYDDEEYARKLLLQPVDEVLHERSGHIHVLRPKTLSAMREIAATSQTTRGLPSGTIVYNHLRRYMM
ncbi:hypothetical protein HDU97_008779 [Phlyctochytrium planicorne]|nr:hypothetical protein HDU97_008779 [Phlyctochytrium planicorne]